MTLKRGIPVLIIALMSLAAGAQAEEFAFPSLSSEVSCRTAGLNGLYVLVYFSETPPGSETRSHRHFSHEYLNLYSHTSVYSSLASTVEMRTPKQALEALGPLTSYKPYALPPSGTLDLYSNDKISYSYRCAALFRDEGSYQKGDIILSGHTKTYGGQIFKVYRHWY